MRGCSSCTPRSLLARTHTVLFVPRWRQRNRPIACELRMPWRRKYSRRCLRVFFFWRNFTCNTRTHRGPPHQQLQPPPRHPHRRASPARPSHPTYPRAAAPHALGSAPTVPVGRQATHHLSARRGTIFRAVRVGMTPAVAGHRAHTSPHRYNMHVLRPVRTIQRCTARGAASEGRAQPAKGCAVAR